MTVFDYTLTMLRRAVESGYAWPVSPAEARAVVDEVERLRAENGNVRAEAGGMEMEIFDLRAQMEQLGADMAELARVRAALNAEALDLVPAFRMMQAIAKERAAVVAYLLAGICDCVECMDAAVVRLAREIERGEHRRKEER